MSEIRATSETGGQKGLKPEAYGLVPPHSFEELSRVYGFGASKYSDHNWAKGYNYTWSLSALQRHIAEFAKGNSRDSESGLHHLAHAAFHLFTLMEFERTGRGKDDRLFKQYETTALSSERLRTDVSAYT